MTHSRHCQPANVNMPRLLSISEHILKSLNIVLDARQRNNVFPAQCQSISRQKAVTPSLSLEREAASALKLLTTTVLTGQSFGALAKRFSSFFLPFASAWEPHVMGQAEENT